MNWVVGGERASMISVDIPEGRGIGEGERRFRIIKAK
jgi:hypothetical protein